MGSECSWRRAGCPRSTAPASMSLSRRWMPPPRPSAPSSLTLFDPYIVNGQRVFMETCWLPALDGAGIDVFVETMDAAASAQCALFADLVRPVYRQWAASVHGDVLAARARRRRHRCLCRDDGCRRLGPVRPLH